MPSPVFPWDWGLRWVQMCMRVGLSQTKNGFPSRCARSMKSMVALRNSSSIVSMRFLVSGPVSSHLCLPQDPTGTELCPEGRVLWIVAVFGLLFGIEVIMIAEEFVEAVHRRRELVAIAEVVLAELPG